MIYFLLIALVLLFASVLILFKPFKKTQPSFPIIFAAIFFLIVTFLYYQFGSIKAWQQFEFKEEAVKKMVQELKSPQKVIERMKEKLTHEPESEEGWFLLGRLQRAMSQFDEAAASFQKAFELDKKDGRYYNAYLEARFWKNGGLFQPVDIKLIQSQKKLKLNDENLSFLAGHYFQHQAYKQALFYWEMLLGQLRNDPDTEYEVRQAIEKTKLKIRQHRYGRLTVTLSVDEALRDRYPNYVTVFIYVKVSRSGPPVAAVRRALGELPATVTLSDAEAMIPNRLLSQYARQTLRVAARLEPSGRLTKGNQLPLVEKTFYFKPPAKIDLKLAMKLPKVETR